MKRVKVSLDEVLGDDASTPFWRSIQTNPDFPKFMERLEHITEQSRLHGCPYNEIGANEIKGKNDD